MALKRLTTKEMVQISGPWLDKTSAARKAIDAQPMLAPIVARVEEAHAALHASQPAAPSARVAALQAEAFDVDLRHDALVRGIDMVLSGIALLAIDRAEEMEKLRRLLLPDGLQAVQATYRAEAGAVKLLETRLAADGATASLSAVPILDRSLKVFVDEWIDRGKKLGALEDERAGLTPPAPQGPKEVAARNLWIRSVNALMANAQLAGIEGATEQTIFASLQAAERTADRRGRAPKEAGAADEKTAAEAGSD